MAIIPRASNYHAPSLDQVPVELLGIVGSFLPPEDQSKLELASGEKLVSYILPHWRDEMEQMPGESLLKICQIQGEQFKPRAEQPFFTQRHEHAQQGKKHLRKRDWIKL